MHLVDKIKEDELTGHLVRMGEKRNAYRTFLVKPEQSGRPRRRWEDNINMDL